MIDLLISLAMIVLFYAASMGILLVLFKKFFPRVPSRELERFDELERADRLERRSRAL